MEDGLDTMFFLKDWLVALSLCFHSHSETCFLHHDRRCELEDPFSVYPLLTERDVYGRFLQVLHTHRVTLVSSLANVAVSLPHNVASLNGMMALAFRIHTSFSKSLPLRDRCEWRDAVSVVFLRS